MTDAPLDAELLLRALQDHKVDYVLIGGLAVQTHGHVRSTNDADIIPAPDRFNLERLAAALRQLQAKPLNPGHSESAVTADLLPRATLWQFATPNGEIDVAHEVPGGAAFADLMRRALRVRIDDLEVAVVSLDDLIRMKLARGRPIDLADVAALTDEGPEDDDGGSTLSSS
ncbi:MAG: hypothetical protein LC739_14375 [Actinobacteria bacterium]|nr:hypothetical protein [Actinomycetota bacterium]